MGYFKVTSGPSTPMLTTSEAKNYLKLDTSADDTLIDDLVLAATNFCEEYLGQKFITQTVSEVYDKVPKAKITDLFPTLYLTAHPVQSVTSIVYTDTSEVEQTWSSSLYKVDLHRKAARITPAYGEVFPDILAEINSLTVTYVVGYGDASSDVPASIRQAIRLVLSDMYHNRIDYAKEKYSASQSLLDRLNYNLFVGI